MAIILPLCVVATYVNINVIDKHLYISCESEKRTCLLRKMTNVNTHFVFSAQLSSPLQKPFKLRRIS